MEEREPQEAESQPSWSNPFCPFCFMQQFEVAEGAAGSVYCEVCGIDVPVRDLVKL